MHRHRSGSKDSQQAPDVMPLDPQVGRVPLISEGSGEISLQRVEEGSDGVHEHAEQAVERASGSTGSPLPSGVKEKFESSLGADLGGVRIHTDSTSAEAARSVSARAYTLGQDIHFGAGHYDPTSAQGEHLLAHEVAHTVQQGGGTASRAPQFKLEVSHRGDPFEVEADQAADAMVQGHPTSILTSALGVARKVIQRDEAMTEDEYHTGQVDKAEKESKEQVNKVQVTMGATFTIDKGHKDEIKQKADLIDGWVKAMDEQSNYEKAGTGGAINKSGAGGAITGDMMSDNIKSSIRLKEYAGQLDNEQSDMSAIRSGHAVLTVDYTRAIASINAAAAMYGIDLKKSKGDGAKAAKQMKDGMGIDKEGEQAAKDPAIAALGNDMKKLANDYNTSIGLLKSHSSAVKAAAAGVKGATARFRVHQLAKEIKDKTAELNAAKAEEAAIKSVVSSVTTAALAACGAESMVALELPNPTMEGATKAGKGLAGKGAKFILDEVKENAIDAPITKAIADLTGLTAKLDSLKRALGKLEGESEAQGDIAVASDVEKEKQLLEKALNDFNVERKKADNLKLQLRDGWKKLGAAMDKAAGGDSGRFELLAKTVGECDAFFGQAQKVYNEIKTWETTRKQTIEKRNGINADNTTKSGVERGLKAWEFVLADPGKRLYGMIEHPIMIHSGSGINSNEGQNPNEITKGMKADIRQFGKGLMDYRNNIVKNVMGIDVPYPEVSFMSDADAAAE